jgi:8-oxo-dGTP diphosphatase
MTRRLVVATAIVDSLHRPTRLLAARRSRPAELAGRWEFPGGKAEPGEAPVDAVHREIREELGVTVTLGDEIVGPDDGGWFITDRHVMRLWFATVDQGDPVPLVEHDALEWLAHDALWTVDWLDGDVPIVETRAARLAPPD